MKKESLALHIRRVFKEGEPEIGRLYGNLNGLKPSQTKEFERLYQRRIPADQIITPEIARQLTELSLGAKRQVGILVNRKGNITHVIIGDHQGLFIPDLSGYRSSVTRLRGLRLVHTHLNKEPISQDDLTDLTFLHLDLVTAISVDKNGLPGKTYLAYLLPQNPQNEKWAFLEFFHPSHVNLDFLELITSLEEEFERKQKPLKKAEGREKALLISVSNKAKHETHDSLNELRELAESCNISVLDYIIQYRPQVDPRHLLGQGKLREVAIRSIQRGATLLVFDCELNPAQVKSITDQTEMKVVDRTQLILDIFAQRAQSKEGKIQVELAQLKYLLPRLVKKNTAMSRLMGGIGGRGPGEQKLEIDRRRVRDRINRLEKEIKKLQARRITTRKKREKGDLPIISIVGYTNAGKSTLLNSLTHSQVHVEDRLFATLDPTSRRLRFPRDTEVIITDTVGFIRDLPQDLVNAFRATLEELSQADLLVHIIDVSNPNFKRQMDACEKILTDLELERIPMIRVFNKDDRFPDKVMLKNLCRLYDAMSISAVDTETLIPLTGKIEELILNQKSEEKIFCFPGKNNQLF
ncbi:MAG TPA: GTPase HflX [Thermodesulfobacteriota bacterium]|nr:GTPase HflX [Thermodesulfobacteriota bacterium]